MEFIIIILFCLFFIVTPFFLQKIVQRIQLTDILSDVVICFGIGAIIGNTKHWWLPNIAHQTTAFFVAETCTAASVLVAIPMLLMTSDIKASLHYAPKFLLSFFLCIVAVLIATFLMVYWFPNLDYLGQTAGCMVGVYVGGTPNMVAISYAVKAPNELFVILNSTDLFCSGIYFIFLTSIAKRLCGLFLPPFISSSQTAITKPLFLTAINNMNSLDTETNASKNSLTTKNLVPITKSFVLALGCIALSITIALLFPSADGQLNELLIMIVLSTSSIFFSFNAKIRSLNGVYNFAQYLLLIFAIAVGFMADASKLTEVGTSYLTFNALLVICLVVLHFIFALILKIDVDTFIITATACIFGPPFIGQVCSAIKNKELLAPGMALGVLGLILGTYLGILVTALVGY